MLVRVLEKFRIGFGETYFIEVIMVFVIERYVLLDFVWKIFFFCSVFGNRVFIKFIWCFVFWVEVIIFMRYYLCLVYLRVILNNVFLVIKGFIRYVAFLVVFFRGKEKDFF